MSIAEKLQTISENELKVYEAGKQHYGLKASVTGVKEITIENVNEHKHNVPITLTSETITDFSNVNITARGKNLCDYTIIKNSVYSSQTVDIYDVVAGITRKCLAYDCAGRSKSILGGFKANTQYTASFVFASQPTSSNSASRPFCFFYDDGTYSYVGYKTYDDHTFTRIQGVSTKGKTVVGIGVPNHDTKAKVYLDINTLLLFEGNVTSPIYESYVEPITYQANANGEVEGVESISPSMVIISDTEDVTINTECYLDGAKEVEKYKNIILNLGGEF